MAKKKKSQLKPVARGFATTSVAKKVTPEIEKDAIQDAPLSSAESNEPGNIRGTGRPDTPATALSEEELLLQGYVDKFQDRVEKDVTRTVKVLRREPLSTHALSSTCGLDHRTRATVRGYPSPLGHRRRVH